MRTTSGDKHEGPPPSNPAQTRDDNVGVEPNGTMSSDRHENTVVQNRADEGEGFDSESVVPRQIPLTVTQKQILLSCGFGQEELDRMRFSTTTEAYDWCGVQMRSPKKRSRPQQQNNDVASPSEKRIRLTRAQKDVLRTFGHSTEELESMRFYTVQEGYRWVGSMIHGFFAPCEYDYYDYYDGDGAYVDDEEFEEEYDDDQQDESSEEESPSEGEEEEEEARDLNRHETLGLENTHAQPTSNSTRNHIMIKEEEEEQEEEEGMETINAIVPKRESDTQYMCEICFEPMGHDTDRQMASAKCGHVYCRSCLVGIASDKRKCPSCGKGVHVGSIRNIYMP